MILRTRLDATSYDHATHQVLEWAERGESRYVCISTVHMVMEGYDDLAFQAIVNGADLVTPDGMPLVWGLKLLGIRHATRVYGPDLTPLVCEGAAALGIPVGFYGGTEQVLEHMTLRMRSRFPALQVAYRHSPPFRPLTHAEEDQEIAAIRASGARILFVGLGCPKQEKWMAARQGRIDAVMLGVGAAFDFLAGSKPKAPAWMQSAGLEWLFRLSTEPRRLWSRYLIHNPRFVGLFGKQVLTDFATRER